MPPDHRRPVPLEDSETLPGRSDGGGEALPFRSTGQSASPPRDAPAAPESIDHLIGATLFVEAPQGAAASPTVLPWEGRAEAASPREPPAPAPAPPPAHVYYPPPPPAQVPQPSGYVHGAAVAPPAIVRPVAHEASAALGGVAMASAAAADLAVGGATPAAFPAHEAASAARPARLLELCFVDEASRSLLLRTFRALLEDIDPAERADLEVPPDDVLEVLARAEACGSLAAAVDRQVAKTGACFVPPIEVFAGTLHFEVERTALLRGVHDALSTLPNPTKPLTEALAATERALAMPTLLTDDVAERHLDALQTATSAPGARSAAASLRIAVTRTLVARREAPRVLAFGAEQARLVLEVAGVRTPLYVGSSLVSSLPALEQLEVHVAAEVRGRVSEADPKHVLRGLALARVERLT